MVAQMIQGININVQMVLFLLASIAFSSCKKNPTYNPFDKEFNISIKQVIKNKCDTIAAGCGYFNLRENSKPSYMYYQVYFEDFHEVVAKGYVYYIDTFEIHKFSDYYRSEKRDSILNLSINKNDINEQIYKYNYNYLSQEENRVKIVGNEDEDTLIININLVETGYINQYVRTLEYFVGRPLEEDYE